MPDIAYPLDPGLSNLPTAYSPVPNNDNEFPVTIFKVLKKKFPTAIKHVGIIWANEHPGHRPKPEGVRKGCQVARFHDRLRRQF